MEKCHYHKQYEYLYKDTKNAILMVCNVDASWQDIDYELSSQKINHGSQRCITVATHSWNNIKWIKQSTCQYLSQSICIFSMKDSYDTPSWCKTNSYIDR